MRSKPVILAALVLGAFLVNLATTLVNVALPALVRGLHATTTQLQWVVDSCSLAFTALLLTFGSLSDGSGARACCWPGWPSSGAPAWPAASPPTRRSSSGRSPLITMFSMTLRPLRRRRSDGGTRELGPEARLVHSQTHDICPYVIRPYAWRR